MARPATPWLAVPCTMDAQPCKLCSARGPRGPGRVMVPGGRPRYLHAPGRGTRSAPAAARRRTQVSSLGPSCTQTEGTRPSDGTGTHRAAAHAPHGEKGQKSTPPTTTTTHRTFIIFPRSRFISHRPTFYDRNNVRFTRGNIIFARSAEAAGIWHCALKSEAPAAPFSRVCACAQRSAQRKRVFAGNLKCDLAPPRRGSGTGT